MWAPDGTRVAFASRSPRGVFVAPAVGPKGGAEPKPLSAPDGRFSSEDVSDWSRDGTRIAFASDRTGAYEIWVSDAAAKSPPVGNRSLGGTLHALNFAATPGDYYRKANDEILVVLQTESPQGVENAEAIYSLPGVDAIFVGPNDLTAQMRGPDGVDPSPAELEAMLQRVLAAGKKVGTPVGLHVQSVDEVKKRIGEGWQFIAIGSELRMMSVTAQQWATGLNLRPPGGELARY